jgi:hypothetical protein
LDASPDRVATQDESFDDSRLRSPRNPKGTPAQVDIFLGLIRSALMMGFVIAVIIALAGLFMIVFGIATGIDRRIQD